ncbi:MAG: NAD(P)/FAD-dependent oxidoreductase [Fimbriiglobus sp.]
MTDVLIVGGGLAGLACAGRLFECGFSFQILEAADAVGGRVRTDVFEGFRLDRGFQIFLPSYPEARRVLDYLDLDLQHFTPGAQVRYQGKFHRVADPRHEPITGLKSLFNPIGTFRDKLGLARLKLHYDRIGFEQLVRRPELTTRQFLDQFGFSSTFIERLAVPFFGGVFLEDGLQTSSRFLQFVFTMFAAGPGAVPMAGMQAIPDQLARNLPANSVRLSCPVREVSPGRVTLVSGEVLTARAVVVAVPPNAARSLGIDLPTRRWNGNTTLYFAAMKSPLGEPILAVNGERGQLVNTVAVMSDVARDYAPNRANLISVSLIGTPDRADLEAAVRRELNDWFGSEVSGWLHLRTYRIPESLPSQMPGELDPWQRPNRLADGLWLAGDHLDNASIDGALTSGHRAAQAVMAAVAGRTVGSIA